MTFTLISDTGSQVDIWQPADVAGFRARALEIRMYYVPEGETILVTHGRDALLMEGGSRRTTPRNAALAQAIAGQLQGRRLRAIVASHPHRDHTNGHSGLVGAVNFAPGARYFDNGIPAATANFQMLQNDHGVLPFRRHAVMPNQNDNINRIGGRFGGVNARLHLLRAASTAQSPATQVYWSVFSFLRFRNAWMTFTGDVTTAWYQTEMARRFQRLQPLNSRTQFLQTSHHGNRTGTSANFAAAMRPAISVASTDDGPGHELDDDTINRLTGVGSQVLATFDPNRAAARRRRDFIIRTDGYIYGADNEDGVFFEVTDEAPAL